MSDKDVVPMVVVVMGVSGVGKSTIGRLLARRLSWNFAEGDALHPPANVAKMQSGQPLTDVDRAPWLAAVAEVIDGWLRRGECGVITCSALKRRYRCQIIGDRSNVRLVYLEGPAELIAERLAGRRGHFMPPSLLDSQFAALEPPAPDERPITIRIDRPPEEIINRLAGVILSSQAPGDPAPSNREGTS
jgi:gluconokinase